MAALESVFRVRTSLLPLGPDVLLHARAEARLRAGPIAEARCEFLPDAPLASGSVSDAGGTVSLQARLASGTAVRMQGRYSAGRLTAEITEADGRPYTVVWDKDGKLLQGP